MSRDAPESKVADMLGDLFDEHTNPTLAFLASAGEIKVRLTAKAATEDEARELIAPVEAEVRSRMGSRIFGADEDTIERLRGLTSFIGLQPDHHKLVGKVERR